LIRFHHASRIPGNDEFARGAFQRVRSGGAPDLEGLNVPVLAAIGVGGRAELDLEGDVFAKIAIRVETKGVETFVAEGVGRADAGVWIHGQSHHRCARAAAKQVEVADVNAGVFFCGRRIEMMRHGESSPKGLDAKAKRWIAWMHAPGSQLVYGVLPCLNSGVNLHERRFCLCASVLRKRASDAG